MAIELVDAFQAAATVDGVPGVPVFVKSNGFSAIARLGVGNYRLTLDAAAGLDSVIVDVNGRNANPIIATWSRFSATTIDVSLTDAAGMAADSAFGIGVWKFTP